MKDIFPETDKAMQLIQIGVSAVKNTNKLLSKYGKITPKLPITLPHSIFFGPAGTGKTSRVEQAVKIMGCSEEAGTFVRVSPDCVKNIEDFIAVLNKHLSWEGYLCNQGNTSHEACNCSDHYIVDVNTPRAPVKQVAIFIDEIHVLAPDVQEKLGLIMLDFRYQIATPLGLKNYFFPKFTVFGATTVMGDLILPLRSRFGNKFSVSRYTDKEMVGILGVMADQRGWKITDEAKELLARASQGGARNAENLLTNTFCSWIHLLNSGQEVDKHAITREVALYYLKIQQFTEEGLSYDQVKVIKFLSTLAKDGKVKGAGISRICSATGIDEQRFSDEIEPRLVSLGMICSGGRGREVTQPGLEYLNLVKVKYEDLRD